jgi:hypothetical protein
LRKVTRYPDNGPGSCVAKTARWYGETTRRERPTHKALAYGSQRGSSQPPKLWIRRREVSSGRGAFCGRHAMDRKDHYRATEEIMPE